MRLKPEEFKEMRVHAGMTLRAAAKATGVPKSTLWAVERGYARLCIFDERNVVQIYERELRSRQARVERILLDREEARD